MNNILYLKTRKVTDERDEFEAKREEWKSTPLHMEAFGNPLWWRCVAVMGVFWTVVGFLLWKFL